MTITGTYKSGVVIPDSAGTLRDGMKVTIIVPSQALESEDEQGRLEELRRLSREMHEEKHEERMQLARQWRDEGLKLADDVREELEAWESQQTGRE